MSGRKHQQKGPENAGGTRLIDHLLRQYPDSNRTRIKQWLSEGRITVDGVKTTEPRTPVTGSNTIVLGKPTRGTTGGPPRGIRILHEDEAIIVIEKEAGLLSVPAPGARTRTAYGLLEEYLGHPPFIVHRLDRDTSGVMLFARTREAKEALQADWDETVEDRRYVALVEGRPSPDSGTLVSWLKENAAQKVFATNPHSPGAKRAVLHYHVLRAGRFSLVEITLETGRKNQIRAQFEELGCPVTGDPKYGARENPLGRLALHALSIRLRHPLGGVMEFESPFPAGFTTG